MLSLDDGPSLAATPQLSPQQRNDAMLATLQRRRVTAVLYVTLNFGADRPEGLAMARAWGEAGHRLGNHGVTHADLHDDTVPLARYLQEIADCDAALNTLPGWRRWFRPTYLHEGHTVERREGLQRFLDRHGYRLARVDLDSRDWQFAPRLQDPAADPTALKAEFIGQLRERARALRTPRDAPAVLLLHHALPAALWLDDVIGMLRAEGFEFAAPDGVFAAVPG